MRAFLDNNFLVGAFATRGICADVLRIVLAQHTLVTSEVVLQQATRVFRARIGLPGRTVDEIVAFLREQEVAAIPAAPSSLSIRDEEDRWVLASAIEAKADVLVAGDRDLPDVTAESPVRIVDSRGLWRLVGARDELD